MTNDHISKQKFMEELYRYKRGLITPRHFLNVTGLGAADDDALRAAIDGLAREHGRLDILHSHAGYQIEGDLEKVPTEGLDLSWRMNVRAHFIAARAAVAHMKTQRKRIVPRFR